MINFTCLVNRKLIASWVTIQINKQFYSNEWATGTGGGISIKLGDEIFVAPSGVQKERIQPEDLFIINIDGDVLSKPEKPFKMSECTPLFMNAYTDRGAGAVMHSHSPESVMVTMLFEKEFKCTHLEMIKGIRVGSTTDAHNYYDDLVIPIIENTAREAQLKERMQAAMKAYPKSNAVLVRRHGVYIWGPTWEKAKGMSECYHYLFKLCIQMKQLGIDPAAVPEASEYRNVDGTMKKFE